MPEPLRRGQVSLRRKESGSTSQRPIAARRARPAQTTTQVCPRGASTRISESEGFPPALRLSRSAQEILGSLARPQAWSRVRAFSAKAQRAAHPRPAMLQPAQRAPRTPASISYCPAKSRNQAPLGRSRTLTLRTARASRKRAQESKVSLQPCSKNSRPAGALFLRQVVRAQANHLLPPSNQSPPPLAGRDQSGHRESACPKNRPLAR